MEKELDDITFEYIALRIINPSIKEMVKVIREIYDEEFSYIEYSKVKNNIEKTLTQIELSSPNLVKEIKLNIIKVEKDSIADNEDYIKNYDRDRCECPKLCRTEIIGSLLDLYVNIKRLENKVMKEKKGVN